MPAAPEPDTLLLFLSVRAENGDTFCFDFSRHAAVRSGGTLTAPTVVATPDGELGVGTPEVLAATFTDSDGTTTVAGKGVRVRITPGTAQSGDEFEVFCKVACGGNDLTHSFRLLVIN